MQYLSGKLIEIASSFRPMTSDPNQRIREKGLYKYQFYINLSSHEAKLKCSRNATLSIKGKENFQISLGSLATTYKLCEERSIIFTSVPPELFGKPIVLLCLC